MLGLDRFFIPFVVNKQIFFPKNPIFVRSKIDFPCFEQHYCVWRNLWPPKYWKNRYMTGMKCFIDMWATITRFAKKNSTFKLTFWRHIFIIKTKFIKSNFFPVKYYWYTISVANMRSIQRCMGKMWRIKHCVTQNFPKYCAFFTVLFGLYDKNLIV